MVETFTPFFEGGCLEEKFLNRLNSSVRIADLQKVSRLYLLVPCQDDLDEVIIRCKLADLMIFPKDFSELQLIFVLIEHSVESLDLRKSIYDVIQISSPTCVSGCVGRSQVSEQVTEVFLFLVILEKADLQHELVLIQIFRLHFINII